MTTTERHEHRFSEDGDCIVCGLWKNQYIDQLEELISRALPYMKTVSRSGNQGYDENDSQLYEEMKAAIGIS